ncbi:MAG: YraN family protein [Chitinophagaceae bacterium]
MTKISFHQKIGKTGEKIAFKKLQKEGFEILHTCWRYGHYEIDIIALNPTKKILHFVEVKTRTHKLHGNPEESISKRKINQMMESANHYLQLYPKYMSIQFNIISIILNPITLKCTEFFMIEDIYEY